MSSPLRRSLTVTTVAALSALALAACDSSAGSSSAPHGVGDGLPSSAVGSETPSPSSTPTPQTPAVKVRTNTRARGVAVDRVVTVSAKHGSLKTVKVTAGKVSLPGRMTADGTWVATSLLEPGTTYQVVSTAADADGAVSRQRRSFSTAALTLDEQTYPSFAPLDGETVGIGMPVIVTFDRPVSDRASIQKHLKVTSSPAQKGAWHWTSSQEVHWRPRSYWKAGTDVTVRADINSIPAGSGIYGQLDREMSFHVGEAHIYKVNAQTHQMQVFSNGRLLRTLPITTGKPGFTTRSGTKVIIEKFASKRMNSETVGIANDSAEGYDLDDVQYAMRVTYSGEFIHAAPWSVGSQGYANVSHGCTGMSTSNAAWLYAMTRRGDVVQYTGTDRPMTLTNGYGDWNESYSDYKAGSAL